MGFIGKSHLGAGTKILAPGKHVSQGVGLAKGLKLGLRPAEIARGLELIENQLIFVNPEF